MAIVKVVDRDDRWTLNRWHSVSGQARKWCVTESGIQVARETTGARRTQGEPKTASRIVETWGKVIKHMGATFDVDVRVLTAVVCIESGGKTDAERYEAHLNDYSIGLCQTLTATAHQLAKMIGLPNGPAKPVPKGGDLDEWRSFLSMGWNSIMLAGAYLENANKRWGLQNDPVLLYASYNAGSPRATTKNPWGLVNYGHALDAFTRFYGDACFVWKLEKARTDGPQ
jgi:soluble lytic murein transglycosylase-like protein